MIKVRINRRSVLMMVIIIDYNVMKRKSCHGQSIEKRGTGREERATHSQPAALLSHDSRRVQQSTAHSLTRQGPLFEDTMPLANT